MEVVNLNYVQKNLIENENILYAGKVHWFVYLMGINWMLAALVLGVNAFFQEGIVGKLLLFASAICALSGSFFLIKALLYRSSTELAITTHRVIVKVGWIKRNTMELNHARIESFNIHQTITGRIFDFGTIEVSGTGSGVTRVPNIVSPLQFRKEAMSISDKVQRG